MSRVLMVGKGPPDRGGISAFMTGLLAAPELSDRHDIELLNLTRDEVPGAGRLTGRNVRRTLADTGAVWRAAPGRDVVHIHTALVPAVTMMRAGVLAAAARLRAARLLLHVHSGLVEPWLGTRGRRYFARAALAGASTVAASEGSRASLARARGGARRSRPQWGRSRSLADARKEPRTLNSTRLERRRAIEAIRASMNRARDQPGPELGRVGGGPGVPGPPFFHST